MRTRLRQTTQAGFTFIELIVVSAIVVLVFGAILVTFEYALTLGYNTRVKLTAQSLANDRMEFFRSLPYDEVGVLLGFPAGTIPQNSTFTLNGFTIEETVDVYYIDGAGDGVAGADSNGIEEDFKQIRVLYEWTLDGETSSLSLTSFIVPRSIETNVGGGTLRVNVRDAVVAPLPGATVRVESSSTTFSYNVPRVTGPDGSALFSVPADSGYQITVGGPIGGAAYSTSSTYTADATNPVPTTAHYTVTESGISTATFQIDELSDLTIQTLSALTEDTYFESFLTDAGIAAATNATTSAGELVLTDSLGIYDLSGTAYLDVVTPSNLERWETVRVVADQPANTTYVIQFYTGTTSAYTLVPDTELPGNSAGFTDTLIDLTSLDPFLYPTTTVGITFGTTDTSVTPAIRELEVFWRDSLTPRPSETLYVRGNQTIGTQLDLTPIYKTTATITTDGSGDVTWSDQEYDTYTVTPDGSYTLATACPAHPFYLPPGQNSELDLVYVGAVTNSLRVAVQDGLGRTVPGVNVRLQHTSGYDVTQMTNSCGQTFFSGGGLTSQSDYELTVSSPGYNTEVFDPVEISGTATELITLSPA